MVSRPRLLSVSVVSVLCSAKGRDGVWRLWPFSLLGAYWAYVLQVVQATLRLREAWITNPFLPDWLSQKSRLENPAILFMAFMARYPDLQF